MHAQLAQTAIACGLAQDVALASSWQPHPGVQHRCSQDGRDWSGTSHLSGPATDPFIFLCLAT